MMMTKMMMMKMIDKYEDDEDYVFVGDDGGAGDVWLLGTDNDLYIIGRLCLFVCHEK